MVLLIPPGAGFNFYRKINSHFLRFRTFGFASMQRFTIGTMEAGGYPALSAHDVM